MSLNKEDARIFSLLCVVLNDLLAIAKKNEDNIKRLSNSTDAKGGRSFNCLVDYSPIEYLHESCLANLGYVRGMLDHTLAETVK